MVIQRVSATGVFPRDNGNGALQSKFSLEVDQTDGTGATWIVNLEGSLDGVNGWTPILTHTDSNPGDSQIETIGAGGFPCKHRRINVVALSLGTNTSLNVKFEGMP